MDVYAQMPPVILTFFCFRRTFKSIDLFIFYLLSQFFCVLGNVPDFADKLSIGNSAVCTVISRTTLGKPPFFSRFCNRYLFHTAFHLIFIYSIVPHYRQNIKQKPLMVQVMLPMKRIRVHWFLQKKITGDIMKSDNDFW